VNVCSNTDTIVAVISDAGRTRKTKTATAYQEVTMNILSTR